MGIHKQHMHSIYNHENNHGSFLLLVGYLTNKNKNLPKLLCDGAEYLPSARLLKKVFDEFAPFIEIDSELNKLLDNAMKCSKLFYLQLIRLITTKKDHMSLEEEFSANIQPIGQRLVDTLITIKYRLRIARLKLQNMNNKSYSQRLINYSHNLFNQICYLMAIIHSIHHSITTKLYYGSVVIAISSIWLINFLVLGHIYSALALFLNLLTGIMIVVLAIIAYPIDEFGQVDISGKNLLAYQYKVFFNNQSNTKMISVFMLQNMPLPK